MIIVRCDTCNKIIKDYRPDYFTRDVIHTCRKCQVHLSERFDKKYVKLLEAHNLLISEFRKVRKECKAFKSKRKQDLLKNVKVTIQD